MFSEIKLFIITNMFINWKRRCKLTNHLNLTPEYYIDTSINPNLFNKTVIFAL